jgi:hypothetical protein
MAFLGSSSISTSCPSVLDRQPRSRPRQPVAQLLNPLALLKSDKPNVHQLQARLPDQKLSHPECRAYPRICPYKTSADAYPLRHLDERARAKLQSMTLDLRRSILYKLHQQELVCAPRASEHAIAVRRFERVSHGTSCVQR